MTLSTTSPGLDSYRDSVTFDVPTLTSGLRDLLGARLVAYLDGVKETRAVRQWAEGVRRPSDAAVHRLRLAYQVCGILREPGNPPAIVQAWFQGAHPRLEDRSPACTLVEEDPTAASPRVLAAARAFARVG